MITWNLTTNLCIKVEVQKNPVSATYASKIQQAEANVTVLVIHTDDVLEIVLQAFAYRQSQKKRNLNWQL